MVHCCLSAFYIFKIFCPILVVKHSREKCTSKRPFLLNFSRGNSRSPASKVIINVKELCAIPASNTFKTGNEIDQLSSFTATGMTNVLCGDYIEEITGNQ